MIPHVFAGSLLLSAAVLVTPAPARAADAAADSGAAERTTIDYSGYQALLNEYLVVISRKNEPVDTRFDYEKLYDARGRRARMVHILDDLFAVDPAKMDPQTRKAWAINLYNFTVLDAVTENLLIPNMKRTRVKSVRNVRVKGKPLFEFPVVRVEGRLYTLDQFERRFVFGDSSDVPVKLDQRAHFALVCGAVGCPPLWPRVFRPDSLDVQLDQVTRNALKLPRHLRFDEQNKLLEGSQIFNWYANDFGGHDNSLGWVMKYAPSGILSSIKKHKITRIGSYPDWNWELNQVEHKRADS